jgi:hypothetical protein
MIVTGTFANMGSSFGGRERRRARDHALAKRYWPLAPGHDPVLRPGEAPGGRQNVVKMNFEAEISDDVRPLATRGERDGAGPFANGKTLDSTEGNSGFAVGGDPCAQRVEQSLARTIFPIFAGDANVERGAAIIIGRGHWLATTAALATDMGRAARGPLAVAQ